MAFSASSVPANPGPKRELQRYANAKIEGVQNDGDEQAAHLPAQRNAVGRESGYAGFSSTSRGIATRDSERSAWSRCRCIFAVGGLS